MWPVEIENQAHPGKLVQNEIDKLKSGLEKINRINPLIGTPVIAPHLDLTQYNTHDPLQLEILIQKAIEVARTRQRLTQGKITITKMIKTLQALTVTEVTEPNEPVPSDLFASLWNVPRAGGDLKETIQALPTYTLRESVVVNRGLSNEKVAFLMLGIAEAYVHQNNLGPINLNQEFFSILGRVCNHLPRGPEAEMTTGDYRIIQREIINTYVNFAQQPKLSYSAESDAALDWIQNHILDYTLLGHTLVPGDPDDDLVNVRYYFRETILEAHRKFYAEDFGFHPAKIEQYILAARQEEELAERQKRASAYQEIQNDPNKSTKLSAGDKQITLELKDLIKSFYATYDTQQLEEARLHLFKIGLGRLPALRRITHRLNQGNILALYVYTHFQVDGRNFTIEELLNIKRRIRQTWTLLCNQESAS